MNRSERKAAFEQQFRKFVPPGFESMVVDLLFKYPVKFKIVPPRSTKLGDFRAGRPGERHQITVNGDLNPYAFLVTTLHEFAHLETFEKFGWQVPPHGEEWKREYRRLLLPAVDSGLLPSDLESALLQSMVSTKASSCSDIQLSRVLRRYDHQKGDVVPLETLPKNTTFVLQGKIFTKGELRRRRYACAERTSNRIYLVHALAEVSLWKDTHEE